jgi:ABC-type thiamine transport system ATPase subunit
VLLNITGGGRYRQRLDRSLVPARPALELDEREILLDGTLDRVVSLFR